jgi:hypothetical protein
MSKEINSNLTIITTEQQAGNYVGDLVSCARAFGFNRDECWKVGLVSDAEKKEIEKKYFPTISVQGLPGILEELLHLIKKKLSRPDSLISVKSMSAANLNVRHMIAYNATRLRVKWQKQLL